MEQVRRYKEEMRNKAAKDNANSMSKDQLKYAEMSLDLENLTSIVSHENSFLSHLKKLAKQIDVEYEEEMGSGKVVQRRRSISKSPSPDDSPKTRGSFIGGRSNFKKIDMRNSNYSSLSPKLGRADTKMSQ